MFTGDLKLYFVLFSPDTFSHQHGFIGGGTLKTQSYLSLETDSGKALRNSGIDVCTFEGRTVLSSSQVAPKQVSPAPDALG